MKQEYKKSRFGERLEYIPQIFWGQDHWTTFLYVETRVVDYQGQIDIRQMRCNNKLHPHLSHTTTLKEYPTQLRFGIVENHDDWSCLEDMEMMGFVKIESVRGNEVIVSLTTDGWAIARDLRRFRAESGKSLKFFWDKLNKLER